MPSPTARRVAALLLDARASGTPLDHTTVDCAPATRDDVLAIQSLVADTLGATGAWKVGAKSPDADSAYAPIAAAGIHASPARLPPDAFPLRGIEAEIAFRLARDLPPRAEAYTADEVADAVDAVLPVIEVVETRLADREAAGPLWQLADNQSHGALILGAAIGEWRSLDVLAPHVRVAFDGEAVVDRVCRNNAGDPFAQVVKLANLAGDHCGGLRAGQVITTGSLTGIARAPAGARVEATIAGLAGVALAFA